MRKQQIRTIMLLTLAVCALTSAANAVSLTAIYDFTDLNPLTTSFEGLDFTNDGTLWITSSPNNAPDTLLAVDLSTETVKSQQSINLLNPVALASDGTTLFIGNNGKTVSKYGITYDSQDPIYKGVIDPEKKRKIIGSTFIDSDDMAGLSEEKLGKLAGWLVHVEEMQAGLKKIMDVLY